MAPPLAPLLAPPLETISLDNLFMKFVYATVKFVYALVMFSEHTGSLFTILLQFWS